MRACVHVCMLYSNSFPLLLRCNFSYETVTRKKKTHCWFSLSFFRLCSIFISFTPYTYFISLLCSFFSEQFRTLFLLRFDFLWWWLTVYVWHARKSAMLLAVHWLKYMKVSNVFMHEKNRGYIFTKNQSKFANLSSLKLDAKNCLLNSKAFNDVEISSRSRTTKWEEIVLRKL